MFTIISFSKNISIIFDTAYVGEDSHRYIHPAAFIEYLQSDG